MREALHNAVVHKNYSSGIPIQIRVYADKISLWNPGQLPANWTVERLLRKHASHPFSPDVANAFFRVGMIEAWGRGIERVIESCHAADFPRPEIRCDHANMRVEFPFASGSKAKTSVKSSVKILELLKLNSQMTIPELAEQVGITTQAIEKNIKKLQDNGSLARVGPTKGGHWKVID